MPGYGGFKHTALGATDDSGPLLAKCHKTEWIPARMTQDRLPPPLLLHGHYTREKLGTTQAGSDGWMVSRALCNADAGISGEGGSVE
jgi:hypothetical protein